MQFEVAYSDGVEAGKDWEDGMGERPWDGRRLEEEELQERAAG